MPQYAALLSIVFMIGFVWLFDRQHQRHRLHRLFATAALMTPQELDWIRRIQSACEDARIECRGCNIPESLWCN